MRAFPVWASTLFKSERAAGSRTGSRACKGIPADGFAAVASIRTGRVAIFDGGTDLR